MGQISMEIIRLPGSLLSGNQQPVRQSPQCYANALPVLLRADPLDLFLLLVEGCSPHACMLPQALIRGKG
jgi:hypothetical protein